MPEMSSKKTKVTAEGALKGILMVLDNRTKRPTVELLSNIREIANDALEVLSEKDPIKQRIGFILLAIQQSTEVKVNIVKGKRMTRVTVHDITIYNWALEEIHALAGTRL
jgi:hypothetical protein